MGKNYGTLLSLLYFSANWLPYFSVMSFWFSSLFQLVNLCKQHVFKIVSTLFQWGKDMGTGFSIALLHFFSWVSTLFQLSNYLSNIVSRCLFLRFFSWAKYVHFCNVAKFWTSSWWATWTRLWFLNVSSFGLSAELMSFNRVKHAAPLPNVAKVFQWIDLRNLFDLHKYLWTKKPLLRLHCLEVQTQGFFDRKCAWTLGKELCWLPVIFSKIMLCIWVFGPREAQNASFFLFWILVISLFKKFYPHCR